VDQDLRGAALAPREGGAPESRLLPPFPGILAGSVKRHVYCIVEGTYLVRWNDAGAEYLKPDMTWHPYPDMWDVITNGREIGQDEETAMAAAGKLFERMRQIGFKYS
jgi:hypothetical protein